MTAIQELISEVTASLSTEMEDSLGMYYKRHFLEMLKSKLETEKKMLNDAIMYALDEDGHTGDWKIKFANDYYDKRFK